MAACLLASVSDTPETSESVSVCCVYLNLPHNQREALYVLYTRGRIVEQAGRWAGSTTFRRATLNALIARGLGRPENIDTGTRGWPAVVPVPLTDTVIVVDAPPFVRPDGRWWERVIERPCLGCPGIVFATLSPRGDRDRASSWSVEVLHDQTCGAVRRHSA